MPRKKKTGGPKKLQITQVRSAIGRPENHKRTLEALGLKRHQQTIVKQDDPATRGMIFRVRHLVTVQELEGSEE